jgi:hypothetical protein
VSTDKVHEKSSLEDKQHYLAIRGGLIDTSLMGAAEEYLREVGGTEAFSEAVYGFLRKEDGLPLGAPIGSAGRIEESTQEERWSHNGQGQALGEEERADLEQRRVSDAAQDLRRGQVETTDLQDSTRDDSTQPPVVGPSKVERVSAPMGALLGLAEQLENMLKEEGAKGWNGNNSESVWDGGNHYESEFKDIGVDPNAGHVDRQSSGDVRASIESGGASSQGGRRSELLLFMPTCFFCCYTNGITTWKKVDEQKLASRVDMKHF